MTEPRLCGRCRQPGRTMFETTEGDRRGRCVRFVGRDVAPPPHLRPPGPRRLDWSGSEAGGLLPNEPGAER